jgi:purine-binding chemotaxis protein CheW
MKRTRYGDRSVAARNLVAFEVGGVAYAVDIQRVKEIVRPLPVVPLPHLPHGVIGVVDHRGDVTPIIDLRLRFGVPQASEAREVRWIVVTHEKRLLGLVVDRVSAVLGAQDAQTREPPAIAQGQRDRGIKSACSIGGRLVFVLDVDVVAAVADELSLPASPQALPAEGG